MACLGFHFVQDSAIAMKGSKPLNVRRFVLGCRCHDRTKNRSAFTITELAVVLAGCALLIISALPLLGNSRLRSERLVCGNNLRQIGVAFQTWSDSFADKVPWQVQSTNGGTAGNGLIDSAWYHYIAISNELANPALLGCPSDNVKLAKTWDTSADGGFLNPGYRNNALSYLVGGHAEIRLPLSVLAADRNMIPDFFGAGCSIGFHNAIGLIAHSSAASWNLTNVHSGFGNVLLTGGNVVELSTLGLRKFISDANTDNGSEHFLLPR
jgi:hypothetical protein